MDLFSALELVFLGREMSQMMPPIGIRKSLLVVEWLNGSHRLLKVIILSWDLMGDGKGLISNLIYGFTSALDSK